MAWRTCEIVRSGVVAVSLQSDSTVAVSARPALDALRPLLGPAYRRVRRELQWRFARADFRVRPAPEGACPFLIAEHATPLVRRLAGMDPVLQMNKVVNLRLAAERLDGLTLQPGQRLSFWREVGPPSRRHGFIDGAVLERGKLRAGVGGGLCQMTNLLYWMTLHTPLTVTERWRHSYDVFPDADRTQPFGSGATCAWPALDLQIENRTDTAWRLSIAVDERYLRGAWYAAERFDGTFEVYEQAHVVTHEGPGAYVRHNRIARREYDVSGALVADELIVENHALMMYEPFLPAPTSERS